MGKKALYYCAKYHPVIKKRGNGEMHRPSLIKAANLVTCLFLGLTISASGYAQIEEVVVTAQKRAEDIQDVPISITAVSGDFMESSGVATLQDLSAFIPDLTLSQSSQVANNRIIMRGVGSVGNSAIEPSVAVFIDGVYYPRPSSVVGSLTDLDMVEVLRGPQGTMFGRNASMGALNIRTRKPTQEFEGKVRASYGNFDAKRVSASVSGGLAENTAGRLSFQYSDRSGYGDNTYTTNGSRSDVGAWDDLNIRGQLNFTPSDNLDITLSADYSRVNNEGGVIEVLNRTVIPKYAQTISAILSPTGPFAPTGPVPEMTDGFDYTINQDHKDKANDDQWGISANIEWLVADHTIRSITSYREWKNTTYESALRLPADLFNRDTKYNTDTVSQELQLISPTGGKLEYVAGIYYYNESYKIDQNFDIGADFCAPAVKNLVAARTATNGTAATTALATALAPVIGALAPTVAAGIISGTIASPADALAAGVAPGALATVFAAAGAITPAVVVGTAGAIGSAASAFCAAGPQDNAVDTAFNQDLTSFAVYGQLTFNITDQLHLTGGLRYTDDSKDGSFVSLIPNPIVAPPSLTNPFGLDLRAPENYPNLKFSDQEVTWLANLSYYVTDDVMVYGTYSTGYKTGGFNSEGFNSIGIASGAPRIFGSESVENYEFGIKSTLFDKHMVANLNYFNTQISDFQDRQFDGVNFIVQNAGVLTQQGVELDIQVRPVEQLYAVMGASYLDSEFDSFPNATNLPAIVAATQAGNNTRAAMGLPPLPVPPQDLTGKSNHFSPDWQLSMMAEWTDVLPQSEMSWFLRGEYQYIGDQNLGAETNQNPQSIQQGYDLVNARGGLRGPGEKWELSMFVRNAFNKSYCQTIFNQPIGTTLGLVDATTLGGMQRCVLGTPRTWGVEAAYSF